MILIKRLVMMQLITPEGPPCDRISKKTIWISSRRSNFYTWHTRRSIFNLPGFLCLINGATPILLLHDFHFQIPENQLCQYHHPHYSLANSWPSSSNYPSLRVHYPHRHYCNPSLVETRLLHNQSPVQISTFPNTKWQLLR